SELEYLVPKGISQFIGAKGLLPTKLKIKGSKNKLIIDTDLLISGLDDFKFSNWLDINESLSQEIKIKAQTTVTPQTIYSKNSTISFAKNSDSIVINSDFQVNDWSLKNKINYRAFFDSGSAAKNGQVLLDIVEPHLVSLKPLNLDIGKGFFTCDNLGDDVHRQTNCLFRAITPTIARKYGIGDLRANIVNVNLLSFDHKPLYVQTRLRDGDWNGIGYKRILFDMDVNGNLVSVNNLVAKLKNSGTVRANTTFDMATLESTFKIDGDQVSANELIHGIWGFGAEVPEGKVSGAYRGQTKGILPNEMFFNLKGQANLIVKDGKLSQLKTMQKLLTAINTIKNFDINNVFQVLVTYQGGHFNQVISSLNYDLGKISTEKLLLKSDSIELDLKGYVDYSKDRLEISGRGLIPKHSKSILQTVGIGPANLGNLFSLANLGATDSKRLFSFSMIGPATNMDKTVESIKSSFKWKED
ncbi:MAG: hypothetical protein LW817_03170, partial [Candidatus Caenarcaniphilales bacterium]|nr:hypothetical protein [Candidatus Caenarcaniphilales bacterium]